MIIVIIHRIDFDLYVLIGHPLISGYFHVVDHIQSSGWFVVIITQEPATMYHTGLSLYIFSLIIDQILDSSKAAERPSPVTQYCGGLRRRVFPQSS